MGVLALEELSMCVVDFPNFNRISSLLYLHCCTAGLRDACFSIDCSETVASRLFSFWMPDVSEFKTFPALWEFSIQFYLIQNRFLSLTHICY